MFQARNVSTTSVILQLLHQHYYQLLQSSTVQLRLSNRRMFVNTVRSPTPSARVLTSGHIVIIFSSSSFGRQPLNIWLSRPFIHIIAYYWIIARTYTVLYRFAVFADVFPPLWPPQGRNGPLNLIEVIQNVCKCCLRDRMTGCALFSVSALLRS